MEEEKFYTWDEIEKELSELELKYGDSDEIVTSLITPSVSSYWRKKLEEEKLLHQKILETKEEEKKLLELKLKQQEEIIEQLKQQIEQLERGEYDKLAKEKEELRLKEIQLELERERLRWQQEIQGLEFDKKLIEDEVVRAKREFEKEKQELLVYYNRQFDTLLEVQKELIEETNKIEKELEQIVQAANLEIENLKKSKDEILAQLNDTKTLLEQVKLEKNTILQEKELLEKNMVVLKEQNKIEKKQLIETVVNIIKSTISEIRSLSGIIIGSVNFCERYYKSKNIVKFHHNLILNTVQRILVLLDELTKSVIEIHI